MEGRDGRSRMGKDQMGVTMTLLGPRTNSMVGFPRGVVVANWGRAAISWRGRQPKTKAKQA